MLPFFTSTYRISPLLQKLISGEHHGEGIAVKVQNISNLKCQI